MMLHLNLSTTTDKRQTCVMRQEFYYLINETEPMVLKLNGIDNFIKPFANVTPYFVFTQPETRMIKMNDK
jgi:hypothetical protein